MSEEKLTVEKAFPLTGNLTETWLREHGFIPEEMDKDEWFLREIPESLRFLPDLSVKVHLGPSPDRDMDASSLLGWYAQASFRGDGEEFATPKYRTCLYSIPKDALTALVNYFEDTRRACRKKENEEKVRKILEDHFPERERKRDPQEEWLFRRGFDRIKEEASSWRAYVIDDDGRYTVKAERNEKLHWMASFTGRIRSTGEEKTISGAWRSSPEDALVSLFRICLDVPGWDESKLPSMRKKGEEDEEKG